MRIRFYDENEKYIDEYVPKEEYINVGVEGSVIVLHGCVYKIISIIPHTTLTDGDVKNIESEYIKVKVELIG